MATAEQLKALVESFSNSYAERFRAIVMQVAARKYGYPPDKQAVATNTVLPQAELLSDFWSKAA